MIKINKNAFTIAELLIGILLAVIVSEGAIMMLGGVIKSNNYEKEMVSLQSDIHHVSEILVSDFKRTGFVVKSKKNKQPFFWDSTEQLTGNIGSKITSNYENINGEYNCNGFVEVPNIRNTYQVIDNVLFCGNKEIVKNVVFFQILYGIDFNQNGVPDRYLKANVAKIPSNDSSNDIVSIKIDLIISSDVEYSEAFERDFYIIGAGKISFNDGKMYRSLSRTVALKNML